MNHAVANNGYDKERVLIGANSLFAAEFLLHGSKNLQERITSCLCFTGAVESTDDVYKNFEGLLKALDETFHTQGTLEDFKMASEVHDLIEGMFVRDPQALSGVLYDINQSRQVFGRSSLVMPEPKPRLS